MTDEQSRATLEKIAAGYDQLAGAQETLSRAQPASGKP
jgi:hypothetical protein